MQTMRLDDQSCRLAFTFVSGQVGYELSQTGRDFDAEWRLLKQLEPDKAAIIEAEKPSG